MPETSKAASPTTHVVVNTITYVMVVALVVCAACWLFNMPWWAGLMGGIVLAVVMFGVVGDRLIPKLTGPIIDAAVRRSRS